MNVMDARSCAKAFGRAGPGCVATSLRPGALCACFENFDAAISLFQLRKPRFPEEETNRSIVIRQRVGTHSRPETQKLGVRVFAGLTLSGFSGLARLPH